MTINEKQKKEKKIDEKAKWKMSERNQEKKNVEKQQQQMCTCLFKVRNKFLFSFKWSN